jgi:hypothetical protein
MLNFFMSAAPYMAMFGAVNNAIGSYYQAKTANQNAAYQTAAMNLQYEFDNLNRTYMTSVRQYEAKSQSLQYKGQAANLQMESTLSQMNARLAEADAQQILLAGKREEAQTTAKYGRAIASTRASMAARGVVLDEGSSADVMTAMDLAKQQDALTINANAVRAANSMRVQALNYETQSKMQKLSAENLLTSADNVFIPLDSYTPRFAPYIPTVNPGMSAFNSLLGGASNVANSWFMSRRYLQGTG